MWAIHCIFFSRLLYASVNMHRKNKVKEGNDKKPKRTISTASGFFFVFAKTEVISCYELF